jgi:hypothetical protein
MDRIYKRRQSYIVEYTDTIPPKLQNAEWQPDYPLPLRPQQLAQPNIVSNHRSAYPQGTTSPGDGLSSRKLSDCQNQERRGKEGKRNDEGYRLAKRSNPTNE